MVKRFRVKGRFFWDDFFTGKGRNIIVGKIKIEKRGKVVVGRYTFCCA